MDRSEAYSRALERGAAAVAAGFYALSDLTTIDSVSDDDGTVHHRLSTTSVHPSDRRSSRRVSLSYFYRNSGPAAQVRLAVGLTP